MLTFLSQTIPWWVWGAPSIAVLIGLFVFVSRTFGLRNALVAVAIAGSGTLLKLTDMRGRQKGWDSRVKKEKQDAERVVGRAEKAKRDAAAVPPERLRDDDGFRRD